MLRCFPVELDSETSILLEWEERPGLRIQLDLNRSPAFEKTINCDGWWPNTRRALGLFSRAARILRCLCVANLILLVATRADADPTLSINDVNVNEGDGSATFTVTLSEPSGVDTTFDYATADGTAIAPGDYNSVNGSGTITARPDVNDDLNPDQ